MLAIPRNDIREEFICKIIKVMIISLKFLIRRSMLNLSKQSSLTTVCFDNNIFTVKIIDWIDNICEMGSVGLSQEFYLWSSAKA